MELARNLKVESILRLQPAAPVCLRSSGTVAEAVRGMRAHRTGCVLVCAADRTLLGIFTERDLLKRVAVPGLPLSVPLSRVMTPDPATASPGEAIAAAVRRMQRGPFRHLPVVSESGCPVGVLSVRRIVHYLVEHFPSTICCLPPDPDAYPSEREGA
ncbi:MAG: CBS domain-containing protein [Gemmataceae bacterium]|nr:CBS domain-containing protein [Gemmataceae bacterium]